MVSIRSVAAAAVAAVLSMAGSAHAVTVDWVDWTTVQGPSVFGVIDPGPGQLGVTYTGARSVTQVIGAGPDYWVPGAVDPYTGGVVNRPPGTDYVGLQQGGLKTITFSHAVTDPYLALFNWDAVSATFSTPFTVVGEGCATLGCGTFDVSHDGLSFTGQGHGTGVLKFEGTFTSITFTDTSSSLDQTRGFRVGIEQPAAVPEPSSWLLMIAGFGGVGALLRKGRRILAAA